MTLDLNFSPLHRSSGGLGLERRLGARCQRRRYHRPIDTRAQQGCRRDMPRSCRDRRAPLGRCRFRPGRPQPRAAGKEGDWVRPNQVLFYALGNSRSLLTERSALNFLQTLSATATTSRHFAEQVAGTALRTDTRKTLPCLVLAKNARSCRRLRQPQARRIRCLIGKITSSGGIAKAISQARAIAERRSKSKWKTSPNSTAPCTPAQTSSCWITLTTRPQASHQPVAKAKHNSDIGQRSRLEALAAGLRI